MFQSPSRSRFPTPSWGRLAKTALMTILPACFGIVSPAQVAFGQATSEAANLNGGPGPEHDRLNQYVGQWTVTATGPVLGAHQAMGHATNTVKLGGRFLETDIHIQAGPLEHVTYTLAFDRRHDRYAVIAMDNTGTYFVTAQGAAKGSEVPMYGTDDDPVMQSMGLDKEFAIVYDFHSADAFQIEVRFIDTRTSARAEQAFVTFDFTRSD